MNISPVHKLAQNIGKMKSIISRHLHEIGKKKKIKLVQHESTGIRKNDVASSFFSTLSLRHENDPFLKHIVTCDEKWILYNNTKRSAQWLDKNEAL